MVEGRLLRVRPTAKADVRLESGPSELAGAIEIYLHSTVPSFSDDLWNTSSERVVRRQLGLSGSCARACFGEGAELDGLSVAGFSPEG